MRASNRPTCPEEWAVRAPWAALEPRLGAVAGRIADMWSDVSTEAQSCRSTHRIIISTRVLQQVTR